MPGLLKKYGVDLPNVRNNFHLNDKEKLENLVKKAGFKNILIWDQFCPYDIFDEKEFWLALNIY